MDLSTYQAYWPGSGFLDSATISPSTIRATDPAWWVQAAAQSNPGIGPGMYSLPTAGAVGITGPHSGTISDCYDNCMKGPWGSLAGGGVLCATLCSGSAAGVPGAGALSGAAGAIGARFQHVGIDVAFAIIGVILVIIALVVLTRPSQELRLAERAA